VVAALVAGALAAPVTAQDAGLPPSALAVRGSQGWREWWSSARAPDEWTRPHPEVARAVIWKRGADGVQWGEVRMSGDGEAWRIRVIVVRLDPRRVRFRVDTALTQDGELARWSVDASPAEAIFAVNGGQFPRAHPWGWVVQRGRERQRPAPGPLSMGVAFDSAGSMRWIPGDSIATAVDRRTVTEAFQSYPVLLREGRIPEPLGTEGQGVSLEHRDARAAIGQAGDGTILVVLTRFDGANGVLGFVPFGVTTPEMAAIMGALGARNAVMLDGGISSQMMVRGPDGVRKWHGLRRVPLAIVAIPREPSD
jgi:exopolysaccharide biosynthesis protein